MTSHREAPSITEDPVADNTDVYAFVSPDATSTVTIIANFIPFEEPAGGPNFHRFGDNVRYEIKIDNDGDAIEDITYRFRFRTKFSAGTAATFLYNEGVIAFNAGTGRYDNLNVHQLYSVRKVLEGGADGTVLGSGLITPPVNIGPRSTPSYSALANAAIHTLGTGEKVFAGQRDDGFYVDLGSIFDLGALRPVQNFHLLPPNVAAAGRDDLKGFNVHSIAIQVPKTHLTHDGSNPTDPEDLGSVIGVWASASRRKVSILGGSGSGEGNSPNLAGPFTQVSRLGMPLTNEVIIPMDKKDGWNALHPSQDAQFLTYFEHPRLQALLPILYPGVFPNLAAFAGARADLVAIFLTGIPDGVVPGFDGNFTGPTQADMLRLNMAIAPTYANPNLPATDPKRLGLLGGDIDGFPNGRRVFDDTVDIEVQAVAGATLPFVTSGPVYVPDAAVPLLRDRFPEPMNDVAYLTTFPYLGHPHQGFAHSHD